MNWSSPSNGSGADFFLSVARGLVSNVSHVRKFGRSAAATTGTDIWAAGTSFVQPATASICNVVSASANDAAAGTGARTVFISGIGSNYETVSETVTLNGTTNVPTVNAYWHINRSYVVTAGSGGTQAGNITITSTAAGTPVLGNLLTGYNQTQSTIYMVPLGYTAYLALVNISTQNSNANGTCDISMYVKPFGGVFRVQNDWMFRESGTTSYTKSSSCFLVYPEKSVVKFRCVAASAAVDVSVDYDIFLVANS